MSTTRERLLAYQQCELDILQGGQNIRSPDGRTVALPDLGAIQAEIRKLQAQCIREQRGHTGYAVATFGDRDERERGFRR